MLTYRYPRGCGTAGGSLRRWGAAAATLLLCGLGRLRGLCRFLLLSLLGRLRLLGRLLLLGLLGLGGRLLGRRRGRRFGSAATHYQENQQ